MAGHSKWANIKHKKAKNDAKRGKIFTKLIREVTVAARKGGADIDSNPWLRLAVDKARGQNMKNDVIDRAIARGAGTAEGDDMVEIRYEGYGPAGVAVMVDCLTDNKNRTVAEVRHAFTKHNGNLGTDGSVAFMFNKQGMFLFTPETDEDALMEAALEAGAEDVSTNDDGSKTVLCNPDEFMDVKTALEAAGYKPENAEIVQIPTTETTLNADDAEKMLKLIDRLEDLDDVQEVHTNADIPAKVMEQLDG